MFHDLDKHKKQVKKDRIIYENCKILSPDEKLLFRCGQRKLQWYLERNLGELIDENTLKLTFEPNGLGNQDDYHLAEKENRCVVCGSTEYLTKHHVVPHFYRKHLAGKHKKYNHHDVLATCIDCHSKYEVHHANQMKKRLAKEYDAPLQGKPTTRESDDFIKAHAYARTIYKYGDTIPDERLNEMKEKVREFFGKDLSPKELKDLVKSKRENIYKKDDKNYRSHGQIVVESIESVQEFVERWRKDFVKNMKPKYLPKGWDISNPV